MNPDTHGGYMISAILILILILFLLLTAFALYCCACNTTPYDRETDDEQQIEYLRQYRERHKKQPADRS